MVKVQNVVSLEIQHLTAVMSAEPAIDKVTQDIDKLDVSDAESGDEPEQNGSAATDAKKKKKKKKRELTSRSSLAVLFVDAHLQPRRSRPPCNPLPLESVSASCSRMEYIL